MREEKTARESEEGEKEREEEFVRSSHDEKFFVVRKESRTREEEKERDYERERRKKGREESGRRRLGRRRIGERKGEGGEISPSSCYARALAGEQGGENAEGRKREECWKNCGVNPRCMCNFLHVGVIVKWTHNA